MKNRRTYLLRSMLCVCIALIVSVNVSAQKTIGIDWDSPTDINEFERDLEFFNTHNVSFLILEHPLVQQEMDYLDSFGIPFLVRLNNKFITNNTFKADSISIINSIKSSVNTYDSLSTYKGVIGITNSDITSFTLGDGIDLYFEKNNILSSSNQTDSLFEKAFLFQPKSTSAASIHSFASNLTEHSTLVLSSEWFKTSLEEFPELRSSFDSELALDPTLIPLPELPNELPIIHWAIVVLVLLWISLAVNIGISPTYLETIPRYFTAHRFFVDDIMSYRERTSKSAIFLLFQHAFFGGLVVYILAKVFISNVGLEALYYHLPYIALMGKNYFSLFFLTAIIIFIVELIAVLWIYLPNKEMTHLNQPLNLFTWIFHLDFIFGTLIVTAFFAELSSATIIILSICYLVLWFSSFNITALGASKRLGMTRNAYLFKTIGLHTLVSIAILVLLINFDGWWDLLELVISV